MQTPMEPNSEGLVTASEAVEPRRLEREDALATKMPALAGGRYELCEFISKGGMGAVYRARDVELGRSVAVKCLLDANRRGGRDLAIREARTLASLSHPNIMRVFDVLDVGPAEAMGSEGAGQVHDFRLGPPARLTWIVSEWLDGRSLAQLPLPLPPGCVLAIMTQVYDALAAAHAAQVIHRDIKPSNIMISPNGLVTLIDFGVAFAPGASTGETLAGSLRYTDPRILEGQTPDALADLYSAALLQVELMTGETVLPDLAPLPLYRHIRRHLEQRLDALLDGSYPPLVNLVRRCIAPPKRERQAETMTAREAAVLTRDALGKLTQKTPEAYLASGLCQGAIVDPLADRLIAEEAEQAIGSSVLTPRQKAAWIAFKAAGEAERPALAVEKSPAKTVRQVLKRQPKSALVRRLNAGQIAKLLPKRRPPWWALILVIVTATLLPSLTVWLYLRHLPLGQPQPAPMGPLSPPTPAFSLLAPGTPTVETGKAAADTKAAPPPPASTATSGAEKVPVRLVADAWANVAIDGHPSGRLPQAAPFMLAPGTHQVLLTSPVVEAVEATIQVEAGKPMTWRYALTPKTTPLRIVLKRPGHLFIDGRDLGGNSRFEVRLAYGKHRIWVQRARVNSAARTLALTPGAIPREMVLE